jgi:hypothetical protein
VVDTTRSEFEEIPAHLKERVEEALQVRVFEVLHAEAVQRGDLPAPPKTLFTQLPGRLLVLLMQIGVGAVVGSIAVLMAVVLIRKFSSAI